MLLRQAVMDQPPAQRLDFALYLIEEMSGRPEQSFAVLRDQYKLRPSEVRLVCALNAASPRVMTKEALYAVLFAGMQDATLSIINVHVASIRKKMGAGFILTCRGVGYSMPVPMVIPQDAPQAREAAMQCRRWGAREDADLRRMVAAGSQIAAMAEELDRSGQAVAGRIGRIRRLQRTGDRA